jgi:hypothetical protein
MYVIAFTSFQISNFRVDVEAIGAAGRAQTAA